MSYSIANLKENITKIAHAVYDGDDDDDDEELSRYSSGRRENGNSLFDRRNSHSSAHSMTPTHSPLANGFDSPDNSQIEQYKAEIKRLRESEAAIKAMSVNYAALLKERENENLRLHEENGTLKQNLHATNAALSASKNTKGSDQSSRGLNKGLVRNRSTGSPSQNGNVSKQEIQSNGIGGSEKELSDLLEEKSKALAAFQSAHESEVKQLSAELKGEHEKLSSISQRLHEEQKMNRTIQQELSSLRVIKDQLSSEMAKVRDEMNHKIADIGRLKVELQKRDHDATGEEVENLKRAISALEKENNTLKIKNDELVATLETTKERLASQNQREPSGESAKKEEMELSLQNMEKELNQVRGERDKALHQLNRLKQHLLEKEAEEADKMDEDSRVIEELRANNDYQKSQIMQLEGSLKQAHTSYEELKLMNESEIKKYKEEVDDLNRKLHSYMSMIETKNVEVLNLQTALGQYYAEIEAKERLAEDLAASKEESARLTGLLKESYQQVEALRKEKEEMVANVSKSERMLGEGKNRLVKLEGDNEKLRRALEQSMTRLNRMSMESDFLVDRRIVIKLLVTYFQRNHSKEVLDLMVRMLGFSDEDKQRIGVAQQGGKGVVRGVLGLPGRLVGGILGGGSSEVSSNVTADGQSFADLWVDFLLKENEEREKREMAASTSEGDQNKASSSPSSRATVSEQSPSSSTGAPHSGVPGIFSYQDHSAVPYRGSILQSQSMESEFSTVPLSASENNSQVSRLLTRYP